MGEFFDQLVQLASVLFNTQALMETLSRPEFLLATFVMLNLIIFTETGLLIGFFLPGDSLLVTTGIVFRNLVHEQGCSEWLVPLLMLTLSLSAIIGDSVGYAIGRRTGPKIFRREKSFFFRRDHLLAAQAFYERHGGKTIVLARFMPILRTFAPVVAGVGQMEYRRFVFYNVFGGIGWVVSMILTGYFLPPLLDPLLQPIFGPEFKVQKHIEKVIIIVVLLSISPGIVAWLRHRLNRRSAKTTEPAVTASA
ncbi:MAG: VTT domain-containing protein [Gemmataceae bacterium]|nr:VTT domain-containing protein [Gemmataceae bacterium]